ncbi:MAG: MBL fold metallo-hydrolase, partial [Pseudomonadota bacterium]
FSKAYRADDAARVRHHGEQRLQAAASRMNAVVLPLTDGRTAAPVEFGPLRVTAFNVDHGVVQPAYGYRFDYHGRSVVVSGDTRKDGNLQLQAQDADILVHEAQNNDVLAELGEALARSGDSHNAAIVRDVLDYHTTAVEAAEVARDANVDLLVIYHVAPPLPNRLVEKRFMRGVEAVGARRVRLSQDGDVFELPLDGGGPVHFNLN